LRNALVFGGARRPRRPRSPGAARNPPRKLMAPLAAIAAAWFAAQWIAQRIGGYTGDTLGAVQQLAELAFLVVAALFIAH